MPKQRPRGIFVPLAHPLDAGGHVEIQLWLVAHWRNHAITGYDRLAPEWLHHLADRRGVHLLLAELDQGAVDLGEQQEAAEGAILAQGNLQRQGAEPLRLAEPLNVELRTLNLERWTQDLGPSPRCRAVAAGWPSDLGLWTSDFGL